MASKAFVATRRLLNGETTPYVLMLLGATLFVLSILASIVRHSWVSEDATHSPIILVIAFWLLVRQWSEVSMLRAPGSFALALFVLLPALVACVVSQWLDWVTIASYTAWAALIAAAYAIVGGAALRRLWFPLGYLLLALPLPRGTTVLLTQDMRLALSDAAVGALDLFGYPVARAGVTLFVDRYQLLVEEACSGLNSIISLSAVGLFYAYVRHGASWRYVLVFTLFMTALAIAANLIRIIVLMLITYHYGNAAASGPIHETVGLLLFIVALAAMFGTDKLLTGLVGRQRTSA